MLLDLTFTSDSRKCHLKSRNSGIYNSGNSKNCSTVINMQHGEKITYYMGDITYCNGTRQYRIAIQEKIHGALERDTPMFTTYSHLLRFRWKLKITPYTLFKNTINSNISGDIHLTGYRIRRLFVYNKPAISSLYKAWWYRINITEWGGDYVLCGIRFLTSLRDRCSLSLMRNWGRYRTIAVMTFRNGYKIILLVIRRSLWSVNDY